MWKVFANNNTELVILMTCSFLVVSCSQNGTKSSTLETSPVALMEDSLTPIVASNYVDSVKIDFLDEEDSSISQDKPIRECSHPYEPHFVIDDAFWRKFKRYEDAKGKYGYKHRETQELLIPAKYDFASLNFSEDLAKVVIDGKHGYIDINGTVVIPLEYDYGGPFSSGLAEVRLKGKYGFIDKTGKQVLPFEYDYAYSFRGGRAQVLYENKLFYIDTAGNCVKNCP